MENTELQKLNLNEQDFKMIIDGLDALPNTDLAGELMVSLLSGMINKDDPEAQERDKRERANEREKKEIAKAQMREDIKILQGKLLMLKRYLIENNALEKAQEFIR